MTEWHVPFWGKPFNITVIQVYAPTTNAEEGEAEWFYEDIQDLLEPTPQKDVLFIIGDWNAKERRDTWSNREVGFGVQNEAGQRLTEFCQDNALIANTSLQQYKRQEMTLHMDITRWSIPKSDWLYFCIWRQRSSIQSAKTRLGVDCGSDH